LGIYAAFFKAALACLVYPQEPGFSKKASSSSLAVAGFYTLSATRLPTVFPSALGFACRPYDRFAFVEDEEAAGLICTAPRHLEKCLNLISGRKDAALSRPFGPPDSQADAYAPCLYDETYVRFAECQIGKFK
jgi:hypothetical protein